MSQSAIDQLKASIFLDTAKGYDLSTIGMNYGVKLPELIVGDDLIRSLLPLLSWSSKVTLEVLSDFLYKLLGGYDSWEVYEIRPNEIVIELDNSLVGSADLGSATYVHQSLTGTTKTTTTTADIDPGDTSVTVTSTTGFVAGQIIVDIAGAREEIKLNPSSPFTGLTANFAYPAKKHHKSGANIYQYVLESASSSYIGDYYSSPKKYGTLDASVSSGASTATIASGHNLPSSGYYIWEYGTSREERFFGSINASTNVLTIQSHAGHVPTIPSTFAFSHSSGASVRYDDDLAATNEDSSVSVGGNPIVLYDNLQKTQIKNVLEILKASGVVATVVIV